MGCSNTTILAFLDASFIPVKKKKKKAMHRCNSINNFKLNRLQLPNMPVASTFQISSLIITVIIATYQPCGYFDKGKRE